MRLAQLEEVTPGWFQEDVYLASAAEEDPNTRRELMKVLGSIATGGSIRQTERAEAERASLPSVIEDYFSDDPERAEAAANRLAIDLKTNAFEILMPSGHVSLSESDYHNGSFYQNGYSQRAMYAHGALHAKHLFENRRRVTETLNEMRVEKGFEAGRFKTHYLVEISCAPGEDEAPIEVIKSYGYDARTWKVMFRLIDVNDAGHRVTESASVNGVSRSGKRHDAKGVSHTHDELEIQLEDNSPTGKLQGSAWIRKDRLKNRVVSFVRVFDEGLELPAFFGNEGQTGNYDTIVQISQDREKQAEEELESRVHDLALSLIGADCERALKIMARHAKDFAADLCIINTAYDAQQFGWVAVRDIEQARYYAEIGEYERAELALKSAKKNAIVFMCGMSYEEDDSDKECVFESGECPLCLAKNVKTTRTANWITCGVCKKSKPVK
ncbi:MAG TPA: hypothetical protein VMR18_04225 [Candidatus Saccharimonadales bacterium]|jgi:hypothetical protein|nr:hypothetical protein [Candidatus Saccharimonadales bacterium]